MKRKIFVGIVIIILISIGILYFFTKNNYKTLEFGNNTIKSVENIKEYILNLESYEAQIEVEVHSNKNVNRYKAKQYYQAPNIAKQELQEPESIKGLCITYDGTNLKLENTKLNLSKIYENYPYVTENNMWLSDFIESYKKDNTGVLKEEENQIIMQVKMKNEANKSNIIKTLYVDKKTAKPTKLTIEDENKKMLVYILYNEIKMNSSR